MHERFIARQPIFDGRMKVFAYELLFREGEKNVFTPHREASSSVIVDSATLFDLKMLTGYAKAFINVDQASLLRESVLLLPADRIVVEILETVVPSPEVIEACKKLRGAGYVLALDDFDDHAKWGPLLEFVKFLKIDFNTHDSERRRAIAHRYIPRGVQLLAEKVETQQQLKEARTLGYSYFQGYFFCKPTMVSGREIPGGKLNYLRLVEAVSAPEFSYTAVEDLFKQEPALTYKLLRYLNSPLVGLRNEVHSIPEAIALLGERQFKRWVSVVAIVGMAGGKPPELIRTALTRAYFCEDISESLGMNGQSSDLFFMGLLSVTDALLDRPMEQILANLPVAEEVRAALCGGSNRFRDVYETLLAYEHADWDALATTARRFGTIEEQVPGRYLSAVNRADAIVT